MFPEGVVVPGTSWECGSSNGQRLQLPLPNAVAVAVALCGLWAGEVV